MTLTLALMGSSGWRVLPRTIAAPLPVEVQEGGLMPLPMNTTAKRFGNAPAPGIAAAAPAAAGASPNTDMDSSHGRAMVTPTPRRKVRRLKPRGFAGRGTLSWPIKICLSLSVSDGFIASLGQKLRAGDDGFDKGIEAITVGGGFF